MKKYSTVCFKFTSVASDQDLFLRDFNLKDLHSELNDLKPEDLAKRDVFGTGFIHYVCRFGLEEILIKVIKRYWGKAKAKDFKANLNLVDLESGYNCLHYAVYYGKFSCVKILALSEYLSQSLRDELLGTKDREGLTPVDLWNRMSSVRQMRQIPVSIGFSGDSFNKDIIGIAVAGRGFEGKLANMENHNVRWWNPVRGACEVFVYGSNLNGHLGTGDFEDRLLYPQKIEPHFGNDLVRYQDIQVSKYHGMILTDQQYGNLYSCGNNSNGRLGLLEKDLLPKTGYEQIASFASIHVTAVSVCENHNLCLDSHGSVFSWGSNDYGQLCRNDREMVPGKISWSEFKKERITGISCSNIYSVAFNETNVFIWGLNIGQFGLISHGEKATYRAIPGTIQKNPIRLPFKYGAIQDIVCLEFATLILTLDSTIHIYMNGYHAKLQPIVFSQQLYRNQTKDKFEVFEPKRLSAKMKITQICGKGKVVGLLYDTGYVVNFVVDDALKAKLDLLSSINFSVVWYPKGSHKIATSIDIGESGSTVLSTLGGEVFKCGWHVSNGKLVKDLKPIKIDKLNLVTKVACDPLFNTFGFLKDAIDPLPMLLPKSDLLGDLSSLSPVTKYLESAKSDSLYSRFFFQKSKTVAEQNEDTEFEIEDHEPNQEYNRLLESHLNDRLFKTYLDRWAWVHDQSLTCKHTPRTDYNAQAIISSEQLIRAKLQNKLGTWNLKVDDCYLEIAPEIITSRCPSMLMFFKNDISIDQHGIEIKSCLTTKSLNISNTNLLSVLIILHYIYTEDSIFIWDKFPLGSAAPKFIQLTKTCTLNLADMFGINTSFGKFKCQNLLPDCMDMLFQDKQYGFLLDTVVRLQDCEMLVSASVLKHRSQYFNVILSRWKLSSSRKVVDFQDISLSSFKFIVQYLYGKSPTDLFNELDDVSDLINVVLELIEISDELLLLDFKDCCQLLAGELLDSSNVVQVAIYAYELSAKKLFEQCCWYIYTNLFAVISDSSLKGLNPKVSSLIDRYFVYFSDLKSMQPVDSTIKHISKKPSSAKLYLFLKDISKFNQYYMEDDRKFMPLIDFNVEKQTRKSRKSSSRSFRTSFSTNEDILLSFRLSSVLVESAIEEDDAPEFIPVVNKKRTKSFKEKIPVAKSPVVSAAQSPALSPKLDLEITAKWPTLNDEIVEGKKEKVSFRSSGKKGKVLISTLNKSEPTVPNVLVSKSKSNPWSSVNEPTNAEYWELEKFPVLSVNNESQKKLDSNESTQVKEKSYEKTLSEIQQEEEFNSWWAKESEKVQKQLNNDTKKKPKKKKKTQKNNTISSKQFGKKLQAISN